MDDQMIRQLLDRYFEGQTSLSEEQQLRRAFQQEDLPEDLHPFRPLFRYFEQERDAQLRPSFEQQLMQQIEDEPDSARTAALRSLPIQRWAVGIAAAVVLALGLFWLYQPAAFQQQEEVAAIDWSKYEVEDPKEAFKITQSALLQASQELNQGTKVAAEEFDTKFSKVGRYFN
ncbi:MAG: hypothetical protein GVY26_11305 [Bacteroidetes bacterium]|jgi:hypothetical protein|nr:hypothetical protein [Bacteroidota bacterium]